jgi:hypothetical protein
MHLFDADDGILAWQAQPESAAAIFDLGTEQWEVIPAPPVDGRFSSTAVWTGSEVLIWHSVSLFAGVAWDPAAGTWEATATGPNLQLYGASTIWTGNEAWTVGYADGAVFTLAYDPARDAWRQLASPPVEAAEPCDCIGGADASMAADGTVLVWTGNFDRRGGLLLRYAPEADKWDTVAGPVPIDASTTATHRLVVTADEAFVWGPQLRFQL